MKTLTIQEALIALGNGEKISYDGLDGDYLHIGDGRFYLVSNNSIGEVSLQGIEYAKNLRIYQEPKIKIKVTIIKFLTDKGKVLEMDKTKLSFIPTKNILDEYEIEVEDY